MNTRQSRGIVFPIAVLACSLALTNFFDSYNTNPPRVIQAEEIRDEKIVNSNLSATHNDISLASDDLVKAINQYKQSIDQIKKITSTDNFASLAVAQLDSEKKYGDADGYIDSIDQFRAILLADKLAALAILASKITAIEQGNVITDDKEMEVLLLHNLALAITKLTTEKNSSEPETINQGPAIHEYDVLNRDDLSKYLLLFTAGYVLGMTGV